MDADAQISSSKLCVFPFVKNKYNYQTVDFAVISRDSFKVH